MKEVKESRYSSLDLMLEHDLYKMMGNPWHGSEGYISCARDYVATSMAWEELQHIHGQVHYQGHIFVVTHQAERRGMGGMDEGSPEGVIVYRVKA